MNLWKKDYIKKYFLLYKMNNKRSHDDDEESNQNKRHRRNDVHFVNATDTQLIDFIDTNPYMYRSIQVLYYLKNNNFPSHNRSTIEEVIDDVIGFIKIIFDNFFIFEGHKISYYREDGTFKIMTDFNSNDEYQLSFGFIVPTLNSIINNYIQTELQRINSSKLKPIIVRNYMGIDAGYMCILFESLIIL
jgi:hypothetical protein